MRDDATDDGKTAEEPATEDVKTVDLAPPTQTIDPPGTDRRPRRAPTLGSRGIERYRLGSEIGHGGMGEIIGAFDEQIGREVAVKRMKERNPSERSMRRFFREASVQGRLDHPAIVPVYELGVDDDGRPYFTMKRLRGTTLAERIDENHSQQRLLRAFVDVCLAIELAHSRKIIHRDIKPQNIVLGDFGEVYVLDWGVAKLLDEADEPSDPHFDVTTYEPVTVEGTVVGTRAYMAPEQAQSAADVDGRADVYSLGCVLFEILAGEPLFRRDADPTITRPSARAPGRDIPPELDALCVAATQQGREVRIGTARELAERVERFLDGDRDLAQRRDLARSHLDAARHAFAAGDSERDRRTAMREAGRAVALDPSLGGAGELVTRLMLEPPKTRPPEVQAAIDRDNLETLRRVAKLGAWSYLGFLCLLPAVLAGGLDPVLGIMLLLTIAVVIWMLVADLGFKHLRLRTIGVAVGNALTIALLARIASPFLLAPAVAAICTMGLVFSPTYERKQAAFLLSAAMAAGVLIPWLLEVVGILSPTMTATERGILLEPSLFAVPAGATYAVLVLHVLAMAYAAGRTAYNNRKVERAARNRLHMQAWQLRQLVS